MDGHRTALLDWLACAARGREEPAARAAASAGDGLLERVAAAGTAGHVLDFDDTYLPGVAHLSAPTAPAALVLGAELDAGPGEALEAFAAGFEAMGAMARAGHPALYDGGWHPTAVCGSLGAAVASARLLELDEERTRAAAGLALLRSGGFRSAFGSHGKSVQVGLASAAGVAAARLAAAGASIDLDATARGPAGYEEAFGAAFGFDSAEPAAAQNWIKAYPCCLQTHSAIEAAQEAGAPADDLRVAVHPLSLQAAAIDIPADGLEAKFSISYLVAFTLLHGSPAVESFASLDPEALRLADEITVEPDPGLGESEAVLFAGDGELARVEAALGSPQRPMDEAALAAKRRGLAGDRLEGALDEPGRPVSELLEAAGLRLS